MYSTDIKSYIVLHVTYTYLKLLAVLSYILNRPYIPQNYGKVTCTGIKSYGNSPNESRVVPSGWADKRTIRQT
jgi:hypothetical protein